MIYKIIGMSIILILWCLVKMECVNGKVCPQCFFVNNINNIVCSNCLFGYVNPIMCSGCHVRGANIGFKLCQQCYKQSHTSNRIKKKCSNCNVNEANNGFDLCQSCFIDNGNNICVDCKIHKVNYGYKICNGCYKNKLFQKNKNIGKPCDHRICHILKHKGCSNAAFVLPLIKYRNNGICAWLGLENGGQYKNQCNLIGGKGDNGDKVNGNICWVNIAIREMNEKIKFKLNKINEYSPFIIYNKTPIFLIKLHDGVSRKTCQQQIDADNINNNLPFHLKEMSYVACVNIKNLKHVENINLPISSFATEVIKNIDDKGLQKLGF